ncbi:hypothetical protein N7490_009730 [Penicillium lividum]|nr:hypothetical protein N7490_009730 [Penicillium lividum]
MSLSVNTDDADNAVSSTVSVTDTIASKRKRAASPSYTIYVSQDSEVISTTVLNARSSVLFSTYITSKISDSVELRAVCSGLGATVIISDLVVGSGSSAAKEYAASASATSISVASTSAAPHHRSMSSTPLKNVPVFTQSPLALPSQSHFTYSTRTSSTSPTGWSSSPGSSGSGSTGSSSGPGEYTISTVYSTRTSTITVCPSTITDCPAHEKTTYATTDPVVVSTTVCPVTAEAATIPTPIGSESGFPYGTTETILTTRTSTITACPLTITDCSAREKTTLTTTETLVAGSTVCTATPASSSSSPGSEIDTTSTAYTTYVVTEGITSYTAICPVTATERLTSVLTSLIGSSASDNMAYNFTPSSITDNDTAAGAESTLSTAPGATSAASAAGAEGSAYDTSSRSTTKVNSLKAFSSWLSSSFTIATAAVDSGQKSSSSISSSSTKAATESAPSIVTSSPVYDGQFSAYPLTLAGVIGLVIALFMSTLHCYCTTLFLRQFE